MQVERNDPTLRAGEPVGVDLGIHHLAVTSDGTVVENPRALARKQRKVARLSKKISRKKKGSANWEKAVKRLRRLDLRIACVRKDAINKATTMIARTKPIIVIESLRPQNLVREHKLARSLLDASFGEFIRQMEYKCLWYGSTLIKADPFYPSTKRCSSCGNVKAGMARSERTYSCQVCGFVMDRDLNAARNLASVAASSVETVNACGECVRPEEPSGCESGSGL
jgi:putative transposase